MGKELKCTTKSAYESMNNLKKACKASFSDCKKAEDASVGLIQICNGRTTPSTASVSSPSPAPSPTTAAPAPTSSGSYLYLSETKILEMPSFQEISCDQQWPGYYLDGASAGLVSYNNSKE